METATIIYILSAVQVGLPILAAFLIGALVGSFCNVVGLRWLAEESIVFPNSHCTSCERSLEWYELFPVISWLVLRGKCRTCKTAIHWQYPAIELFTGCLFAWAYALHGLSLPTLLLCWLAANIAVVLITDFRAQQVFLVNTWVLVPAGLAYRLLLAHAANQPLLPEALMTAGAIIGGFAIFELLIIFTCKVFGADGFGHGDSWLMAGLAAYMGWPAGAVAFVLAFFVQSIPGGFAMVWQWVQHRRWVSLIALGVSLVGVAISALGSIMVEDISASGFLVGVGSILAVGGILVFVRQARKLDDYLSLPFGPALAMAGWLVLALPITEWVLSLVGAWMQSSSAL